MLEVNAEQTMFSSAVKLFSLQGFDIKVDPSWLIIASLVTWSLSQHYFPGILPQASGTAHLTMAVIGMLGLFASLLAHEMAHSVVARRLGVQVKSITLFIFGGVAELGTEPSSARDELWIAIAGPLMSFFLALGFWTFAQMAWLVSSSRAIAEVLSYLAIINLVLAVFNMVPAFPLDGGRVLRAHLWHRTGDVLVATRIAARSGAFFGYFLMALGVLALFHGAIAAGLWQVMIGGFVLIAARASYTSQLARTAFKGKTVSALMARNPVTVGPDITLSAFVNQIMLHHGVNFVPVIEGDVLLGHIDRSVLAGIDRENWGNTRVGDVFVGLDQSAMVTPDLPISGLLEIIAKTDRRKFLVVSDHHLIGVITLADLTEFLSHSGFTENTHKPASRH